jgi:hypothetical protein
MSQDYIPAVAFDGATLHLAAHDGDHVVEVRSATKALVIIQSGAITDGSFVFELVDGYASDMSDGVAVADSALEGGGPADGDLEPTFIETESHTVKWFLYAGIKPYVRLDIKTVIGCPVTGGSFSALIIPLA